MPFFLLIISILCFLPIYAAKAEAPPVNTPDEPTTEQEAEKAGEAPLPDLERYADFYLIKVETLLVKGEAEEAEKTLVEAVEKFPDNLEISIRLARLNIAQEKRGNALRTLNTLTQKYPQNHYLRKLFGSYALTIGNLPVAQRELGAAVQLDPQDAETYAILAVVLWKREEPEAAAQKMKEACQLDSKYCSRSVALNSFAKYERGEYEEGFDIIREESPLVLERDAFADLAYEIEEAILLKISPDRRFSAYLKAGGGYDTNAVYDPELERGGLDLKRDAPFINLAGHLGYTPLILARHTLGGDLFAARNHYFGEDASDFNHTSIRAQARYRFSYNSLGIKQSLQLKYLFNILLFDPSEILGEEGVFVFSESHGGRARFAFNHSETAQTTLEFGYARESYRDIRRVGDKLDISLGEGVFFLNNSLKLLANVMFSYNNTFSPAYDALAPAGFLGVSYLMPWELNLLVRGQYQFKEFFNSEEYRPWGQIRRRDHIIFTGLGISRLFLGHLRPEISTYFTKNFSTVESFDFKKIVVQLSISGEY